jgi:hypothetical protein
MTLLLTGVSRKTATVKARGRLGFANASPQGSLCALDFGPTIASLKGMMRGIAEEQFRPAGRAHA